jgi:Domain of unknown function (DUF4375)
MQPEPDWQRLSTLDDGDLQMGLLNWLDEAMRGHYGEEEDALLASLHPPLDVMFLLNWLEFEVVQGSFLAYFANSHGRHATLAAQALRTIGATDTASVLDRARAVFEANSDAWHARREEMNQVEEYAVVTPYVGLPGVEALSDLTDEYSEAQRRDRFSDLFDDYLRRSVKELAASDTPNSHV